MNANITNERIGQAAKRYLDLKGYDLLDETEHAGNQYLVARDEGAIVIAKVTACEDGFPENEGDRAEFEQVALDYLRSIEAIDAPIRFDSIQLCIVSKDRAFLRHAINCKMADCAA